jgi:hypothetical protein
MIKNISIIVTSKNNWRLRHKEVEMQRTKIKINIIVCNNNDNVRKKYLPIMIEAITKETFSLFWRSNTLNPKILNPY